MIVCQHPTIYVADSHSHLSGMLSTKDHFIPIHRSLSFFWFLKLNYTQLDNGYLFYPIDQPTWSPSTNLFPSSPSTLSAFKALQPFQVYSSWNALAVLDPRPFLPPHNLRFRRGKAEEGECSGSECSLICQDYWSEGFGRVLVVPSVQVSPLIVMYDGFVACFDLTKWVILHIAKVAREVGTIEVG